MKYILVLLCQVGSLWGYGFLRLLPPPGKPYGLWRAEVTLTSAGSDKIVGKLFLRDDGVATIIKGEIWGLTPGHHGMHIHEEGDISNNCTAAGEHFNPDNKTHGSPVEIDRHAGDLGNIFAELDGVAWVTTADHLVRLTEGMYNVIGRTVVVHADPDDIGRGGFKDSLTTGHSGARVACGVITSLNN